MTVTPSTDFSGSLWANSASSFTFEVLLDGQVVETVSKKGDEIGSSFTITINDAAPGEYQLVWNCNYNGTGVVYGDTTGDLSVVLGNSAANKAWGGHTIVTTAGDDEPVFEETGQPVSFDVASVSDIQGNPVTDYKVAYYKYTNLSGMTDEAKAAYFANPANLTDTTTDGAVAPGEAPKNAGASGSANYIMAVFPGSDYMANITVPQCFPFEIVTGEAEATEYSLYEINGTDTEDTTFTYDGKDVFANSGNKLTKIGLLMDGKAIDLHVFDAGKAESTSGNGLNDGEYFVKQVSVNGAAYQNQNTGISRVAAGTYKLSIAKYESGKKPSECDPIVYLDLVVEKFDLSKATVTAADFNKSSSPKTAKLSYNGAEISVNLGAANTDLAVSVDSYEKALGETVVPGYDMAKFDKAGTYEFSVALSEDADEDSNFAMSGDAAKGSVRILTAAPESMFNYAGDDSGANASNDAFGSHQTVANAIVVDASKGDEFDAEKINWGSSATYYDAEKQNATVTVTDAATGEVVAAPSAAGLYVVNVQLPTGVKYDKGGSDWFYVKVINGGANVYFTVDGTPASSSVTVKEDGQPVDLSVVVKTTGKDAKVLKEGADYTVEIKDTDAMKAVDEIVEAGNYAVTVKSAGYKLDDATLNVQVQPADYDYVEAVQSTFGYDTSKYDLADKNDVEQATGIAATGEAIVPSFQLVVEKTVDGEKVKALTELDPEVYTVTYVDEKGKAVKAEDLKAAGSYTATLKFDADAFEKVYGEGATIDGTLGDIDVDFSIVDAIAGGFSDVKASEWYADEATKAKQLGYMEGLSGTNMLLPTANITRADVAMVLMRMAGGDPDLKANETYPTKFSDVEADAYYAKAIDWAYKAGIVSGYDGTDSFGPNDLVTREQLAKMIALFAQNVQGEDVSGGTLEGYADADQLTFGRDYMAWCVKAGIFGVNTDVLDPAGNAQRAQVAAISVRLCPAEEL